jgi:hypothetical protein
VKRARPLSASQSSFQRSSCAIPSQRPIPTWAKPTACRSFARRNTRHGRQMLMLKYGVFSTMMYFKLKRCRPSILKTTAIMLRKRKPVR